MVFKKWLLRHFIFGPVCFFLCFFFLPASCGKFRGKLFSFSSVAKVFQSDVLWKRFLLHKQRKLWRFIDLCHERKSVKLPKNINICLFFAITFFCPFFNLRVIPETEERLSRFEEYYWLAKIRRPYEPPLGYANSQYSTKQIWHSDIMRPSRIKLLILCCWKQTFRLCLFWLWTLWTRTTV